MAQKKLSRERNEDMEFEKLQSIIGEVLNLDPEEITPDSTLWTIWGRIPWISSRSSWALRKSLTSRSPSEEAEKIGTVGDAVEQIKKTR